MPVAAEAVETRGEAIGLPVAAALAVAVGVRITVQQLQGRQTSVAEVAEVGATMSAAPCHQHQVAKAS